MADESEPTEAGAPGSLYQHPESEIILRRLVDVVGNARPMPLSASVMISRDEVLEMLEDAIERLPDELRAARWLLKERDDFLGKTRRDADDILDEARARSERMVQRAEVVKAAEQRARLIVDTADDEARRLRLECEDYCDQRLASFEIILERTLKTVRGRPGVRLQGNPLTGETPAIPAEAEPDSGFFDQDNE